MKAFLNIERSAFRPGEYVGHADGTWRIQRINSARGKWQASRVGEKLIFGKTLSEVSEKLSTHSLAS